jgi:hypothetical protein
MIRIISVKNIKKNDYQNGPTKKRTAVATIDSAILAAQIAGDIVSLAATF